MPAGNEPFGKGAVKVGTGAAAEAKAVAQPLCSQLVMLGGELNLTSVLGPRTADVKNVAFNRSMNAGVSLKKVGSRQTVIRASCSALCYKSSPPSVEHEASMIHMHRI